MTIYALSSLISFILALSAGFVVYTQRPKSRLNRLFLALSLCFAGWALVEYGYRTAERFETALFWNQLDFFWILTTPITLHMVLLFTEHHRFLETKLSHALLYSPAAVFVAADLFSDLISGPPVHQYWGWTFTIPEQRMLWTTSMVWSAVLAFIAVAMLVRYFTRATDERRQGTVLLTSGFLLTFLTAHATESILPYFGITVPGMSVESYMAGVILSGMAVWRYQSFRINPHVFADSILESMTDGLLVIDPSLYIIRTNTAACGLFGRSCEELATMQLGTLLHVEHTSPLHEALESGQLHAGFPDVEADAVLPDGTTCPVSVSIGEIPNENAAICLVRDISERWQAHCELSRMKNTLEDLVTERTSELIKANELLIHEIRDHERAEEELIASRQRFREIVELLPEIVYEMDMNGIITFANRQTFLMTGYTMEDYERGFHAIDLIAPEDHERVKKNIRRILNGEQLGANEYTAVRSDGSRFPVLTQSALIVENGRVTGLRGVFIDITDRKKTELELLNYERRFRTMLENVNMLASMVRADDTIEFVNDYFLKVTGWKREDLIGRKARDMLIPPEERESYRNFFATESCPIHNESEVMTASGERRLIAWNNTIIYDTEGNVLGVNSLGEDITEKRSLEHQFLQAQKMETVGRLAGGIAHDFNNLLTIIMGNADIGLLTSDAGNPAHKHFVEIKQTAKRATELTRQLLTFSRRQVTEPKPLNINQVLLDMDSMLRRMIGADIELTVLPGDDLDMAMIDRSNLEQVITNLAVNSRDAMPGGGSLTVSTENTRFSRRVITREGGLPPGRYIIIRITDTGSGIDDEAAEHLFEPFYTTKEPGKGTGLGLATSYSIITGVGGSIDVEHSSESGTSMRIILPRYVGSELPEQPQVLVSEHAPSGTETILLVEDEPSLNRMLSGTLGTLGYHVYSALNGEDAVHVAAEQGWETFDLLVTDVVMPRMSGHELVGFTREHRPDLPVLYMSGYTDNTAVSKHLCSDQCVLIQKPFTPAQLGLKVREVLDNTAAGTGDTASAGSPQTF